MIFRSPKVQASEVHEMGYQQGAQSERSRFLIAMRTTADALEYDIQGWEDQDAMYLRGAIDSLRDLANRMEMGNEATNALYDAARNVGLM